MKEQEIKKQDVRNDFLDLQSRFIQAFGHIENPRHIKRDNWQKSAHEKLNGEGITIVIEGESIERGGVNFSHVKGNALPPSASTIRPEIAGKAFEAIGISIVIHPHNPHVPTAHANLRFFTVQAEEKTQQNDDPLNKVWWFGGGFDLTPYYPIDEDIIYWHQQARACCQPYGGKIYPLFKRQCDEYFYLKHRDETRGVGGLFFDDLNAQSGWKFEQAFAFIQHVGETFLESYLTIFTRHYQKPFTQQQRDFQLYRRGRYVEFNLLFDRGTIFGLQSGGRTESILMSMPKYVKWQYRYPIAENSAESRLSHYLKPKDWLHKKNSA